MLVHFLHFQSKLEEAYHCSCNSLVFKILISKQNEFAVLLQKFIFQNFTSAITRCLVHIFEVTESTGWVLKLSVPSTRDCHCVIWVWAKTENR